MHGQLVRFCNEVTHLVAFVSHSPELKKVYRNALVLIPGLTEGMMALAYTSDLCQKLAAADYSLVQVSGVGTRGASAPPLFYRECIAPSLFWF